MPTDTGTEGVSRQDGKEGKVSGTRPQVRVRGSKGPIPVRLVTVAEHSKTRTVGLREYGPPSSPRSKILTLTK